MTAGPLPARATLRLGCPGGPAVITWVPGPAGGGQEHTPWPTAAVSGEVLIAGPRQAGPSLLEIADVICCPAGQGSPLTVPPGQFLERYPGAAVVAVGPDGGRRCRVATRTGHQFAVTVPGSAGCARAAVLGASFVYCWLAAGCPAVLLESAELVTGVCAPVQRWPGTGNGTVPVPFDMCFEFS